MGEVTPKSSFTKLWIFNAASLSGPNPPVSTHWWTLYWGIQLNTFAISLWLRDDCEAAISPGQGWGLASQCHGKYCRVVTVEVSSTSQSCQLLYTKWEKYDLVCVSGTKVFKGRTGLGTLMGWERPNWVVEPGIHCPFHPPQLVCQFPRACALLLCCFQHIRFTVLLV